MASSAGGGGGRRSPPPAATDPRVVMESLIEVHEGAAKLQTMLEESPTPSIAAAAAGTTTSELRQTIDGMMSSLSSALSALNTTGAGQGPGQGRRRRRGGAAAGSGPQRRSSTRRRSHSPFVKTVTASKLDDGNSWRKYGQKLIQESPNNPRSYYRCTHRPDQGCRATRQVQVSDANPSEFIISYFGQHTCRDPSTIPLLIPDDTTPPPDCANLISFGGGSTVVGGGASSSTTTTTAVVPPQDLSFDPTTAMMFLPDLFGYISSSLPALAQGYRCGSEEALSSSSPPAAHLAAVAVVGSAGTMTSSSTVGSAPADYWPERTTTSDMARGPGTGSFPSSPSSLGFMAGSPFGSFGNAGDDDLFVFDS